MNIKIGDITYAVVEMNPLDSIMVDKMGRFEHLNQIIYLKQGIGPEHTRNTLVHEVLHGIWLQQGMNNTPMADQEEYIINTLTNGLCMVLQDNPHLQKELFLNDQL